MDVIITATRKPQVNEVVAHLCNNKNIESMVVVDSCPEQPSLTKFPPSGTVKVLFIPGQTYFNKSISINLGVHHSSSDWVVICDADVLLDSDFLQTNKDMSRSTERDAVAITPNHVAETDGSRSRWAPGICGLSRKVFLEVNGYCSEFKGWGQEDVDFLRRLSTYGLDLRRHSYGLHISHSDDQRTQCYSGGTLKEMNERNKALLESRKLRNEICGTYQQDISSIQTMVQG